MIARIANLNASVHYAATDAAGVERDLVEHSELFDGDTIECSAALPLWNTTPFTVEVPNSESWVDSGISHCMCVSKGSGMFIYVRLLTSGTSVVTFEIDRGDYAQFAHWAEQVRNQNERGVNFNLDSGATVFRGLRSNTTTGGDWGMGGQDITSSAKLSVDKLQFVSKEPPRRDQVVTIGTESLRIDSVMDTPYAWSLALVNVNQ